MSASFHNPTVLEDGIPLATSNENKILTFALEAPNVVSPQAKIVTTHNGRVIKEYENGTGLAIVNDQTVTLTLQGEDYLTYADPDTSRAVQVWCSLVTPGDVEIIFDLEIIFSPL